MRTTHGTGSIYGQRSFDLGTELVRGDEIALLLILVAVVSTAVSRALGSESLYASELRHVA
jgi:hypothetical protein